MSAEHSLYKFKEVSPTQMCCKMVGKPHSTSTGSPPTLGHSVEKRALFLISNRIYREVHDRSARKFLPPTLIYRSFGFNSIRDKLVLQLLCGCFDGRP